MILQDLIGRILDIYPQAKLREGTPLPTLEISATELSSLMKFLKEDSVSCFDQLQFHTAIDHLSENLMECLYHLNSLKHPHCLMVSVKISRTHPVLPSLSSIWAIAEWQEREVFDMFGVKYQGHPDLRRILLDDDWQGYPLRKDYQDDFMVKRPW